MYGLGNFFIPWNIYANGKLNFPEFSANELAFEWDIKSNKAICHWFKYNQDKDKSVLKFLKSEEFESSSMLKSFTPYENMSDEEYIRFFKINRRKKFLIPLYKNYHNTYRNKFDTFWLKRRAHIARFLASKGLVKWQN